MVASVSKTNRSEGVFSLSVILQGLFASYQATAPQKYFKFSVLGGIDSLQLSHDESSGNLALLIMSASPDEPNTMLTSTIKYSATAYMKFDPDGHLRIYDGNMIDGVDLLTDMSACDYPTACGNYGLCLNGQCSCPAGFARANTTNDQGNYNCWQMSPTTCENPKSHSLLPLEDVYYFNYVDPEAAVLKGTDMKSCKDACLKNCSCNAALFQYYFNDSHGNCFLPSPVLTLTGDDLDYCLQNATTMASNKKRGRAGQYCHIAAITTIRTKVKKDLLRNICGVYVFSDRCFTFSSLYIATVTLATVILSGKLFN
ncbi:hypothetical protein D5086_008233 [Populus alba]|uniref:Uncharacterized protein n=1 Tax=Populus alba TaxID=43335 RepID=A0ACC4CFY8_POPAL